MRDFKGKRYWLVGASEGLGRALAVKLSQAGAEVILSARSTERLDALAAELPGPAQVVAMDIADRDSVAAAWGQLGRIDGMVFLAGVYWPQSAKAWNGPEVEAMFDINLTGAARVLAHVVPDFVARDAGHIVLTGSLSGFRGLAGTIGYGASKAGLMYMAEAMQADLRNKLFPLGEIGNGGADSKFASQEVAKAELLKLQRHFINGSRGGGGYDRLHRNVGEEGNLLAHVIRDRVISAEDDHVGLNAAAAQLLHRMLGGLRL